MKDKDELSKVRLLNIANRVVVKAFKAKSGQALNFILLNDTLHLFRYQRSTLFLLDNNRMKLLGISGHTAGPADPAFARSWEAFAQAIDDPAKLRVFSPQEDPETFAISKTVHIPEQSVLIWVPLLFEGKLYGGLLLEKWPDKKELFPLEEVYDTLDAFLAPSYGIAFHHWNSPSFVKKTALFLKNKFVLLSLLVLLLLLFIRIPLRIAAPAEVVPKDPIVITAPLKGIIEEVIVNPGQTVAKDEILFEYDKQVPLQELAVAKKEVEILQSEVDRALTLGFDEPKSRKELSVLQLKLEKEQIELALAEYQASRLTKKSPEPGIVVIRNPHEWRGKPVEVGERVLEISNPEQTKVRIWIPEKDNIPFNRERKIKVYLNISPESSWPAKLDYVANESTVEETGVVSFIAEADWVPPTPDVKIGLKGTAVLYGENVSLLYWLFRRPWAYLRYLTGF